jgi:prevent-host-death family protein
MINTVSITDLKQNASNILKMVKNQGKPVMVLQRSKATAILVDPEYFSLLERALEDLEDLKAISMRAKEDTTPFEAVSKKFHSA